VDTTRRDRVIVDLQSRFDHLAGVPAHTTDKPTKELDE
jgi:hypothetical protein